MTRDDGYRARAASVRQEARAHLLHLRRQRLTNRADKVPTFAAAADPWDLIEKAFAASAEAGPPFPPAEDGAPAVPEEIAAGSSDTVPAAGSEDVAASEAAVSTLIPAEGRAAGSGSEEDATFSEGAPPEQPPEAGEQPKTSAFKVEPTGTPASKVLRQEDGPVSADAPDPLVPGDGLPVHGGAEADQMDAPLAIPSQAGALNPLSRGALAASPCGGLDLLPGAGPGLVWMLQQAGIASLGDLAAADPSALSRKLGLIGQLLNVDHWIRFAQNAQATEGGHDTH